MRKQPTPAERKLWRELRRQRLGVRFRRQHPIAGFIVDFYCPSARLVVELDGGGHNDEGQRRHDEERDRALAEHGVRVLRLWNPEGPRSMGAALELIFACVNGAPIPERSRFVVSH